MGALNESSRGNPSEELYALKRGGSAEKAMALFDSLPPAPLVEMLGSWRGEEIATGHPLDGLLTRYRWRGKRFEGPEDAFPLVFETARGGRSFDLAPPPFPVGLLLRCGPLLKQPRAATLFRPFLRLFQARSAKARLRMVEFRGVASAAMIYDSLPIIDHFRKLDEDTLLGAMDLRGDATPFIFALTRKHDDPAEPRDPDMEQSSTE